MSHTAAHCKSVVLDLAAILQLVKTSRVSSSFLVNIQDSKMRGQ